MTDERNPPDDRGPADERVSKAYRDLADERVAEKLNESILQEAAKAAGPAYARSILWTRPVAWAATIAISLAIILQVTRVPELQDEPALLPATEPAPAATESPPPQPQQQRASSAEDANIEAPPAADTFEFELQDADMLRRAEDLERMRSGPDRRVGESRTETFAAGALQADEEPGCDDEVRWEPETWQACITRLEEAGLTREAAREREEFRAAFPDFEAD